MSEIVCGVDPCPVILNSTCVFYRGQDLLYIGVNTNDPLQTVIEKINQAFQNSGLGYAFNNGLVQSTPFDPVQLGGSLIQNTTIGGSFTLTFVGNVQAARHITTGGTSSQFVKGDGTLDSTSYQPAGNYLTALSGDGSASGPGIGTFTLSTVNVSPGTFGSSTLIPVVTVNSKGLVTNVTTVPFITPSQSLSFIGDVVGSGVTGTSVTLSLQNVNSNPYPANTFLKFAVNAKGLVTSATPVTSSDIVNALGYTPSSVDEVNAAKLAAQAAAQSAAISAGIATNEATNALNSANSASSSANSASASASTATSQATIATTQANLASQSATNALNSSNSSSASASNAATSASNALSSEQAAGQSASSALSSQQASALSESNALSSANSASASASTATAQAGIATTQAGIATTQAGNALTSANNALNSANAAAASASSASQTGTSTLLTGFATGANTTILGTDTILQAFQKAQGQINARVSGTGVAGQVAFWSGTGTQTGDNGLFWDNTNKRLGIGTVSPAVRLHISETGAGDMFSAIQKSDITNGNTISLDFVTSSAYVPTVTNFGGRLRYTRVGGNGTGNWDIMASDSTGVPISRFRIFNGGNVLIQNGGTFTDAGFRLDVNGTARVQGALTVTTGGASITGLSTIQGTTASDSGQLGTELLTTGTGDASWTGSSFATGYTHVAGSTTTLTSTLAGVVNSFYQITYTVTNRTAGSFTIAFGGFTSGNLTATGAVGPRATTTDTLVITPTSDFNGTIVLSIRVISISSASITFNNSAGTVTNQIRISNSNSNSFYGRDSGRNNTTGFENSFFGTSSGQNNTTGIANTFIGRASGQNNTIGNNNSFVGREAGFNNISGNNNSFIGFSAGQQNTTASGNSYFGVLAGLNNATGSNNIFVGFNSGRFIANASNLTIANNSVFLGTDTRANADNETNQIVIGHTAIGLGSNTTVIGNSSTTFGRWWGNLLIGTSTNQASSVLTMESTTRGFLPPRMTSTERNNIATPATGLVVYNTTDNRLSVYNGTAWVNLATV